jgi:hypothetical protein
MGPKNLKTPTTSAMHFVIVLKLDTLEFGLELTLHHLTKVVRAVRHEN